jgi:threonine/homoserine/homoserine lactone efflux protein
MLAIIMLGFLVGFGLAISIGPVSLIIIRVNLSQGFWRGMTIGLGAVCADFTYLALVSSGLLFVLNKPEVMKFIGIIGAIILFYFGYKIMRAPVILQQKATVRAKFYRHFITGYMVCISSPLAILFWAGMAGTVANIAKTHAGAVFEFGFGLFLGIFAWLCIFNSTLYFLRHRLSPRVLTLFNQIGGLVIIGFGLYGLLKIL